MEPTFIALFVMGLMGSVHCLGMCGGITSALTLSTADTKDIQRRFSLSLAQQLGRIMSYMCAGFIAGFLGHAVRDSFALHHQTLWMRVLIGTLLVLIGLQMMGFCHYFNQLERVGMRVWQLIQPLTRHCSPMDTTIKAWGAGMLWGWLPCGLVYSALFFAFAVGDAVQSSLLMLAFGAGTLPALMGLSGLVMLGSNTFKRANLQMLGGIIMLVCGLLTIWPPASLLPIINTFC